MPTIPLSSLTPEERRRLYLMALQKTIAFAVKVLGMPASQLAIRSISPGDPNAVDASLIDVAFKTKAVSKEEAWIEAAADLTANALSEVTAPGFQVAENTVISVYGFVDLTPNPDLTLIALFNGKENLYTDQVEHCYVERPYGGVFVRSNGEPVMCYWRPKDFLSWKMAFKSATDKNVVLLGFVVEPKGKNITVSHEGVKE